MNTDNLSALAVGIGVVALIAGFGVYFNNPELNKASGNPGEFASTVSDGGQRVQVDKSQFRAAPELAGISNYINTGPVALADLKGKVVLVDFWTYSCINCIRTIPYLNAWYEKYADDGLVIVGVHTPEFDFEKNPANVQAAVEKFGIKYPVVQDNDRDTWSAYENRYWPRKYLVDDEGFIRFDHIGEGEYEETEKVIQALLQERAANIGMTIDIDTSTANPEDAQSVNFAQIRTPELYFGYAYARAPLGNADGFRPGQTVTYTLADDAEILANRIYLSGDWANNSDHMELKSHAGKIVLQYSAKAVNIVAGGSGKVQVAEDGKPLAGGAGRDIAEDGSLEIDGQRLYNLVSHERYGQHTLTIDVAGEGFQIYTFTFG
ncbi:MAG: thioredoxin family protein [Nitrososphaera sp.]|uniref:thioredoxin family protein n=1 Tax=Nitrososphaera sp. TaxID=1971748 RepID=UPI00180C0FB1|nr:thioredoxin family protein [Nitrososphaera sp.]NWG36648.1 thioredoxin family protein [Nitrososphaera sp.]